MRTHQQPQQQRRGGLRLALLVCLLALSHGASAQGEPPGGWRAGVAARREWGAGCLRAMWGGR